MSRRHSAEKREILPDPKFGNEVITKFINCLMVDGKKGTAEKVFYQSLERVEAKIEDADAVKIFETALENVKPQLEVKSRRVGGSTYQVPVEVRDTRRVTLAIRWMIAAARSRSGKSMVDKLSGELMDAFNNRGSAVKKREDTHKMAEANRAFAHYLW